MHVLRCMTFLSMSFSCGDCSRVLPTSVGVAVFFRILALRASMVCIHSLCRGGNSGTFVVSGECAEDGAGNCDPEGVVEGGCGVEAFDDGSEVVAARMMSPDRDRNSSMSSRACRSVSSTQESCAGE